MKKKKQEPKETGFLGFPLGHNMGRHCGFTVSEDRITVAPTHFESMARIQEDREGLNALICSLNSFLVKEYAKVQKREKDNLARIREDVGIPNDARTIYYYDGTFRAPDKEEGAA